jgi:Stage II sporulation protein E (SpoIIE)/PAS fold/GAF domain
VIARELPVQVWGAGRHRIFFCPKGNMRSSDNTPPPGGGERTLDPVTLDALIQSAGLMQYTLGAVIVGTDLRIAWANEAAERIGDGQSATAWPGRRLGEVLPRLDTASVERSLRRVLATGKPVDDLEVSSHADDPGGERFWNCAQFRVNGPDGQAAGVTCVIREVTEQARNQRRLALADEASARIGTTLDITRTAEELLEVAIPRLADMGAVDLLATVIEGDRNAQDQKMRLQQAAVRWPADLPPPPRYLRYGWDPAKLIRQRLAAGLPVYLPAFGAMTEDQIKEMVSDTGLDRMMIARRAGVHSIMFVPLVARGAIMGIVALCRRVGSPPFTLADLSLARDFVGRAAVAVDNARLYTRERATALALQRGLLPRQIPEVPGLDLACRYVPAQAAAEVGGDWFDVIPLPEGRCALTVGDVTGHDISAASLMGQLRTATRTLATLGLAPAQILTRLDQITADLTDAETSATCIYAAHDPATADWDIASAGHPPPAIARPGHPAAFPRLPAGLPLGTGLPGASYRATRLHPPPGSTLVFYTDGLIDTPATAITTGLRRLARALATLTTLPLTQACDQLLATLAPRPADDIAILMARN